MIVYELTTSIVAIVTIANLVHALWLRRVRLFVFPSGPIVFAFFALTTTAVICRELQVSWAGQLLSVCLASWLTLVQALAMVDRSHTGEAAR